jgi:hypothetical protein
MGNTGYYREKGMIGNLHMPGKAAKVRIPDSPMEDRANDK